MDRKMDKGRALSIMGFSTTRPIDAQCGKPDKIREVLDKALFQRTQEMMHGKGGANEQKPKKYVFDFKVVVQKKYQNLDENFN